jgi:FtsZ-binding cell division protein ZapB
VSDDTDALRRAFEKRGRQLVSQRLAFTDAIQDLVEENDTLRASLARAEQNARDLHEALAAAHRQLDEEHAAISFRAANKLKQILGRAPRS